VSLGPAKASCVSDTVRVLLVLLATGWLVLVLAVTVRAYRSDERRVTADVLVTFALLAASDLVTGWLAQWPRWVIPAIPAFIATMFLVASRGHPVRVFPSEYVRGLSPEQTLEQDHWASVVSTRLAWLCGIGLLALAGWLVASYIML
jgi:hypothetical protein